MIPLEWQRTNPKPAVAIVEPRIFETPEAAERGLAIVLEQERIATDKLTKAAFCLLYSVIWAEAHNEGACPAFIPNEVVNKIARALYPDGGDS